MHKKVPLQSTEWQNESVSWNYLKSRKESTLALKMTNQTELTYTLIKKQCLQKKGKMQ